MTRREAEAKGILHQLGVVSTPMVAAGPSAKNMNEDARMLTKRLTREPENGARELFHWISAWPRSE